MCLCCCCEEPGQREGERRDRFVGSVPSRPHGLGASHTMLHGEGTHETLPRDIHLVLTLILLDTWPPHCALFNIQTLPFAMVLKSARRRGGWDGDERRAQAPAAL